MYFQLSEHIHVFGKVIMKPERKFSFLAYLITGSENVLIDTVPFRLSDQFLHNLQALLPLDKPDAIILNHSEGDHSGALPQLLALAPNVPVYCTEHCKARLTTALPNANFHTVESGEVLSPGSLRFQFTRTPLGRQHGNLL